MISSAASTLFERAARVFDGWTDAETGVRVLRLEVRGDRDPSAVFQTVYQQCRCFLDGGRKVLLRTCTDWWWAQQGGVTSLLLDLTTGERTNPFPPGHTVIEVCDRTNIAVLKKQGPDPATVLWDLNAERVLASESAEGWNNGGMNLLADGRALVSHYRGRPYGELVQSHIHLLTPGEPSRVVLEADGFHCNHIQGCPTDSGLFAYDRWPSPRRDAEQVIHIASLDGSFHEPAKLDDRAPRPGFTFGARDHYVWAPDGRRIISYLNPAPEHRSVLVSNTQGAYADGFNHFQFPWVLSALDWRTGEDFAAPYPAGRWGCHMQVTPDGRHIVSAGGPGFDCLYAVSIEKLREGWNERVLCSYPRTVSQGGNREPFAFPFVLPDGSGILFSAGWPGPEHGVYLTEWPNEKAT